MCRFKYIVLFLVICVQSVYVNAKDDERIPVFSVEQLHEDFEYYVSELEDTHPNLYDYSSKEEFNARVKSIKERINKPLTKLQFGLLIMELESLLDGHTGIGFYALEGVDAHALVPEWDTGYHGKFLPWMDIRSNQMYYKNEKVVSINGKKTQDIIDYFNLRITAHDSYARKDMIISHYLCYRKFSYSIFKLLPPFLIKTKSLDGKGHIYQDDGWSMEDYRELTKEMPTSPMEYTLYPKDSIACIDFNSCSVERYENYAYLIDSIFENVQSASIRYLFINVTWNEGGSYDLPYYVFDKLEHKAFYWDFSTRKKVSRVYCDIRNLPSSYYKKNRGKIIRDDEPLFRKEVSSGYSGQVFVIQSPWTFSGANDFCLLIKNSGRGLLVGGRTGHSNKIMTERHIFMMPHTQIEFGCSIVEYIHKDSNNEDGLCPDIPIDIGIYQAKFSLDDLKHMLELAKQQKH